MKIVHLALKYIYLLIIFSFWCFLLFKTDFAKISFYDFLQNLYILIVVIFTIQRFFKKKFDFALNIIVDFFIFGFGVLFTIFLFSMN